ncbi:MAG: PilZ domain-containing protein [Desulfobacterales bacterium]|nr:PilZ domain-containing protein [Desulfobacterales bacterium]MCU0584877.1 PilZ domain-containing protein [Desulfobacterales bacterium]
MHEAEPTVDKYGTTAKLFNLIYQLPRDHQLVLLKQLVGDRVAQHLFKLIVEMTEDQQLLLLEQLGHSPDEEPPEHTVRLEGIEPTMRENPRRPCLINADYRIQDSRFRSYILDISIGGVFIETDQRVPVGETVILNFNLPSFSQPFTLPGKVAWSGPQGFGVKFDVVPSPQGRAIKAFVDKVDKTE